MPTQRIIKSTFIGLNNEPLRNAVVQVIHMQGNTIDNIEYPQVTKNFVTNREGKIKFTLWCNEEGERSSFYRFVLPGGETFDAIVPVGTSDLELSVLREGGGDSSNPQHQSLITYILSQAGVNLATNTVAGKVRTNTNSTDPVVYLKSEVDTLIAGASGADLTNYYNKPQTDGLVAPKANSSDVTAALSLKANSSDVITSLATKANSTDVYTKGQTDTLISGSIPNTAKGIALGVATLDSGGKIPDTQIPDAITRDTELTTGLALKADISTTYTKTETNTLLTAKANQSTTYSKTEVDTLVAASDTLVELADVVISSPSNTQVLTYNSTTSKWTNQTISAGAGETNTASNIGVGGVGIFKQKTGVNLEFKNINAASTKVNVTNDTTNNEVDIDVVEANLSLSNIGGTLPISKGGTGANTASDALIALGGATNTSLISHTSNTSNPHNTTAAQVGNSIAQWNTDKIQSVAVSATTPTNGQILTYNSANTRWEPTTASAATTASSITFTPTGSIAATNVQAAIAEAALEAVQTTGNQSIAGIKTFSDTTSSTSNVTGAVVISGGLGVSGAINAGVSVNTNHTLTGSLSISKTLQTNARRIAFLSTSGNYTITNLNEYIAVNAASAALTINLPSAVTVGSGYIIRIKKVDSTMNSVIVTPNGAQTIEGSSSFVLMMQYSMISLISDASNWLKLA